MCRILQAVAEATARAISEVGITCFVEGKGIACAYGEADINTVAKATASAFAKGYAEAISDCGKCSLEIGAMVDAFSTVVVMAASEAYNGVCLGTPQPPSSARLHMHLHAHCAGTHTAVLSPAVDHVHSSCSM